MPDRAAAAGDWRPTASRSVLRARSRLLRAVREFFDRRGFLEVETPLLSADVCVDAWLEPLRIETTDGPRYLQTSPEFHMKRLLAAGAERIFQVTRSFRGGEHGARHNVEFTIIEWYEGGSSYHQQMDLVADLIRTIAQTRVGDDEPVPPAGDLRFERMAYDEAFRRFAGAGVLSRTTGEIRELADRLGVDVPRSLRSDNRDGLLNALLSAVIEPALADHGGVFLYDYPASQAALARVRDEHPAVAERFELYLDGIEICNGYQELTDADEFDRRMREQARLREQAGLPPLPVRSRLSSALRNAGLPECAGVALGFDRLLMWRLGKQRLPDVMAFPGDSA